MTGGPMKVLVLGGTGHVGARIAQRLEAGGWALPLVASRRGGERRIAVDTRDLAALAEVLRGVDAVVNCVAGSASAIRDGAAALARAVVEAGRPRVVHLSSMAVYGEAHGLRGEAGALPPVADWYGRAKQEAEAVMARLAASGVDVAVLRPGCVWGPGSELWVGRIADWLLAGRLGDLGAGGDGWSNGVHVDDVAQAVVRLLQSPPCPARLRAFNLAAPDSPRWNDYFRDLALAVDATPLRRVAPWRLSLDTWAAGPALVLARRLGLGARLPAPMSPTLRPLWARQLRLDSTAATQALGLDWTPYPQALREGAAWWRRTREGMGQARMA